MSQNRDLLNDRARTGHCENGGGLLGNPKSERIKHYHQLLDRKHREQQNRILVEGENPVVELIRTFPELVSTVIISDEQIFERLTAELSKQANGSATLENIRLERATSEVVDAISKDAKGVVAIAKTPCREEVASQKCVCGNCSENSNGASEFIVVCKSASDPGNAGTIIRAAVAFGASEVVLTDNSVDFWSPKVIRSSAGGVFHILVSRGKALAETIGELKSKQFSVIAVDGYGTDTVLASDLGTKTADDILKSNPKIALVFGNEAQGLFDKDINECDGCLRIPMSPKMESLNLAGAAHILMWSARNRAHN